MKWITTLSIVIAALSLSAQNTSLTIFNNNGQPFFVIMNGIKQNAVPHTNVKVGGMSTGSYEIKLIFADGKTGDINKKLFIDQPGNYQARVVINGKKRKLQYFGMSDGTPIPEGGTPVNYRPNDESGYSDQSGTTSGQVNGNGQATGTMNGSPGSSSATTGTTATSTNQGGGVNVNVDIQEPTGTGSSVSTSTTTTSSTTTVNGQVTESNHHSSTSVTENGQTTATTTGSGTGNVSSKPQNTAVDLSKVAAPNKPAKGKSAFCTSSTLLVNADAFVEALEKENFDQDKKDKILRDLKDKCVTADQAFKIVATLNFDVDRLEISKYLYDRMTDKGDGERLTGLMSFDVDRQNFREYMGTH